MAYRFRVGVVRIIGYLLIPRQRDEGEAEVISWHKQLVYVRGMRVDSFVEKAPWAKGCD